MQAVDRAYAHVLQRVNTLNTVAGLAIYLLIMLAEAGEPRSMAWIAGAMAILFPANIWISIVLVKRNVRRAEIARFALNAAGTITFGHAIGWPLPIWLFLPFMAVALPEFGRRVVWITLVSYWTLLDAVGLYDGVSWLEPAVFTVLAIFCRLAIDARLRIINDMCVRSDEQHSALESALASLRGEVAARERAEVELRQAQKLEAVGRLAAGIAHEINTPLQFVTNNVEYVAEGVADLLRFTERMAASSRTNACDCAAIEASTADLEELRTGIPDAVRTTLEGVARVSAIVSAMKTFAGPEQVAKTNVELDRTIDAMLAVAKHEYTYVAEVRTELACVPPVMCHAGEIGQVLLNLVVNAAHAIADASDRNGGKGRITIRMACEDDSVVISVADTGKGIPDAIRDKVFEPFFTTKLATGGTGQGLAIARSIIVDRHGGSLSFTSEPGCGTTFYVRIPIDGAATRRGEAA